MSEQRSKQPRLTVAERIIASTIGGISVALAVTPMDVVKTRLQAQTQPGASSSSGNSHQGAKKVRYRGTIDAFVKIGNQGGVKALWRGVGPAVAMTVPSTTIYFALYEYFKCELEDRSEFGYWIPLVAGSGARALAVTATSPVDLFRTNLQSHSREVGSMQLFRNILASGRLSTFFTGVRPTLWRDVPFSGIYWMCYEAIRRELHKSRLIQSTFLMSLSAGAIAGSIAGILTLPFDVLKTRSQMNVDRVASGQLSPEHLPRSTFAHMSQICAREGVATLFQGLLPRIGKVAPACAIMISSYELIKEGFLSRRRTNDETIPSASSSQSSHPKLTSSTKASSLNTARAQSKLTE